MAQRLKNLKLDEVSLVDRGANPGAHIVLFKAQTKTVDGQSLPASAFAYVPDPEKPSTWKLRIDDAQHVGAAAAALGPGYRGQKVTIPAKDRPKVVARVRAAWRRFNRDKKPDEMPSVLKAMDFRDLLAAEDARQTVNELWGKVEGLSDVMRSIMSDDGVSDKAAAIEESLGQFGDWIKTFVSKANGGSMDIKEIEQTLAKQEERIADLEAERDEAVKRAETAETELKTLKGDDRSTDIDKSELPESVRAYIEKQDAAVEALKQRGDDQDAELTKIREEREQESVLAKVKGDYPNLPNQSEIASTLRKLQGDDRTQMEKILKQSNEAMKGLFRERGRGDEGGDLSAFEEATAKAQELMAADPGKYKSVESARAQVWKQNSVLLKRYQDERASKH